MQGLVSRFAGLLLCACCTAVGAQALQQPPAAEDFARRSAFHSVTLSPNGDYVALAEPTDDGMETRLRIVSLDGSGHIQVLRFVPQQHVSDILWTDDDQIVASRARMRPLKATPESYGELLASDVRGKRRATLFA